SERIKRVDNYPDAGELVTVAKRACASSLGLAVLAMLADADASFRCRGTHATIRCASRGVNAQVPRGCVIQRPAGSSLPMRRRIVSCAHPARRATSLKLKRPMFLPSWVLVRSGADRLDLGILRREMHQTQAPAALILT